MILVENLVLQEELLKMIKLNENKSLEIINELESKYGEFFFVFDVEKLRTNYRSMYEAFNERYKNFVIGYSYKTNYLPALIKEMSKLGARAEVVSRLEYDLALKIGNEKNQIIFNGPLKAYDDIALALEGDSIINLDSFYEIEHVKEYVQLNRHRSFKVGLRVNFQFNLEGENSLHDGHSKSRFGFCLENGDFEKALLELKSTQNIDVVGLHGHFSTNIRSLAVYKEITQRLCDLSKIYLADTLEYIDIGGGFYGNVPKIMKVKNVPSFDDYAEVICSIINKERIHFKKEPLLIIEPGLSLVVDTFQFYCKVIDVKQVEGDSFVLVNGSAHNIKPAMHKKKMPMEHVKIGHMKYEYGEFNIVGYTCMERDYLIENDEGEIPKSGDFLVFSNVGAYTIVFAPPFIKERPPIITKDGDMFSVARKKEKLNDFISENVYVF